MLVQFQQVLIGEMSTESTTYLIQEINIFRNIAARAGLMEQHLQLQIESILRETIHGLS